MKRLIVTADDFGRAVPINKAVVEAHQLGILTSASLMITGEAAADAIARARRLPSLSVGLHLTLVDGTPYLPPHEIPGLVEEDGRFTNRLVSFGARLYLDPEIRQELEEEIRAQFQAYMDCGLPLGHVDAHHHYHLHPTVFELLLPIAVEFGCPAIRIPWEPPLARGRHSLAAGLFHMRRAMNMRRVARRAGLVVNDQMFGLADTGGMDSDRLAGVIAALPDGLSEVYSHPAVAHWEDPNILLHDRCEEEYRALIDPATAERVRRWGVELTSFAAEAARQSRAA